MTMSWAEKEAALAAAFRQMSEEKMWDYLPDEFYKDLAAVALEWMGEGQA